VDLTRGRNTRGAGGSDAATRVVGNPTVGNKNIMILAESLFVLRFIQVFYHIHFSNI
jgi:hypothetical protein